MPAAFPTTISLGKGSLFQGEINFHECDTYSSFYTKSSITRET